MANSGTRREFIRTGLLAAGAAGLGLTGLSACRGSGQAPPPHPGLGPLKPVRDETTGLKLLNLPEGFRYRTMAWAGQPMTDGYAGPGRCDGMGVVASNAQGITLVRNHELRGSSGPIGNPEYAYDNTGAGTTTLVFNPETEQLEQAFVSLNGTSSNCAGGVTPWGTWLSCEESVFSPEFQHFGIQSRQRLWGLGNAQRTHGWVFEVDPAGVHEPGPIKDMGQFFHEAAAVDPATGIVYLTEDSSPHGGLYRYIPDQPAKLQDGGRLQMMRVEGWPELTDEAPLFTPLVADWVDIVDPAQGHTPGTHDEKGVVSQGMRAGGTGFRSLEGCVIRDRELYFTSKNGGRDRNGLVFHFHLEQSVLEAVYEGTHGHRFGGPDNLIFSPRGALVICEDRLRGDKSGQFLAGLTSSGELLSFCQIHPNLAGRHVGHDLAATARTSEWAGVCFSPDGKWLFANIFNPGITCAITGPWAEDFI